MKYYSGERARPEGNKAPGNDGRLRVTERLQPDAHVESRRQLAWHMRKAKKVDSGTCERSSVCRILRSICSTPSTNQSLVDVVVWMLRRRASAPEAMWGPTVNAIQQANLSVLRCSTPSAPLLLRTDTPNGLTNQSPSHSQDPIPRYRGVIHSSHYSVLFSRRASAYTASPLSSNVPCLRCVRLPVLSCPAFATLTYFWLIPSS